MSEENKKCPNCPIINLVKANKPRLIFSGLSRKRIEFRTWFCQECEVTWEFEEESIDE